MDSVIREDSSLGELRYCSDTPSECPDSPWLLAPYEQSPEWPVLEAPKSQDRGRQLQGDNPNLIAIADHFFTENARLSITLSSEDEATAGTRPTRLGFVPMVAEWLSAYRVLKSIDPGNRPWVLTDELFDAVLLLRERMLDAEHRMLQDRHFITTGCKESMLSHLARYHCAHHAVRTINEAKAYRRAKLTACSKLYRKFRFEVEREAVGTINWRSICLSDDIKADAIPDNSASPTIHQQAIPQFILWLVAGGGFMLGLLFDIAIRH